MVSTNLQFPFHNEKLMVDKLASFTLAYKSLAVFVC